VKRLLTLVVVLLVLLVGVDRAVVHYVDQALADRMQEDGALGSTPTVKVRGFPFLTQAARGEYDEIDVAIRDVTRNGVTVSRLDVTVLGAKLPLSQVGKTTAVPVLGLRAEAVLTYLELAHESGLAGLTIRPSGDLVEVTGKVAGISATATSRIVLQGDRVLVRAQSIKALGASTSLLKDKLDFSVRLPVLPYNLKLTGASAESDGVRLTASSGPTVLTPQ
jgi:hypothetical protein